MHLFPLLSPPGRRVAASLLVSALILVPLDDVAANPHTATAEPDATSRSLGEAIARERRLQKGSSLVGSLRPETSPANRRMRGRASEAASAADPTERVTLDIVASPPVDALAARLRELGMSDVTVEGHLVSGRFPRARLGELDAIGQIRSVREYRPFTRAGAVRSQGYRAMRTGASAHGLRGRGVRVGVVSDSYDCLGGAAADIASGDVPGNVVVAREAPDCTFVTDEGRALIQILHDIAPDAAFVFHSSDGLGNAGLAEAMRRLAEEHDVDIVLDDVATYQAAFFQDDAVAQAVGSLGELGVVSVTAAGNGGDNSYEQAYRPVRDPGSNIVAHDFDPGPGVDLRQRLTIPPGSALVLILQWDEPFYSIGGGTGSRADLDVFLVERETQEVVAAAASDNLGGDPLEVLEFVNPAGSDRHAFELLITQAGGGAPRLVKSVMPLAFDGSIDSWDTRSGTIVGHANADGAISVGATAYRRTVPFGHPRGEVEPYSARGGVPILFTADGERLSRPGPLRAKPDVTAPAGVNTTFYPGEDDEGDGLPNFHGTSAAAPHVAGAVALMLEANPALTPAHVRRILRDTALDIVAPAGDALRVGPDRASGAGLVHVSRAVARARRADATRTPAPIAGDVDGRPVPDAAPAVRLDTALAGGGGGFSVTLLAAIASALLRRRRGDDRRGRVRVSSSGR